MTFTPKEGMYCRTRDGRTVGPMQRPNNTGMYPFKWFGKIAGSLDVAEYLCENGSHLSPWVLHDLDLVAEWADETLPVRTVTRTEIVRGVYGMVQVGGVDAASRTRVLVSLHNLAPMTLMTADELRAAARVFISLAEALEETE